MPLQRPFRSQSVCSPSLMLRQPLLVAAFAVAVLSSACATDRSEEADAQDLGGSGTQTRDPQTSMSGLELPTPGKPCVGAAHGDPLVLAVKAAAAGNPTYLPTDGSRRIGAAWTCWGVPRPLFMIDDVQLSFESGWDEPDPQQTLQALADEYGGEVISLQGRPARISPASATQQHHSVLIINDGTAIRLLAQRSVEFTKVVSLAEELNLTSPVTASPK